MLLLDGVEVPMIYTQADAERDPRRSPSGAGGLLLAGIPDLYYSVRAWRVLPTICATIHISLELDH